MLAARTRAVQAQLAHYTAMRDLATEHGERWGALVTAELIRRHTRELAWLAELAALYATQARAHGPVPALHLTGVVLSLIAATGALASLSLPAVPNTALTR